MPMLPSSSSALRQVPLPGSSPKMSPTIARPPRPTASCTATGERSTPSANTPRAASACRWRPGPQPTSSTGPPSPSSSSLVGRVGRAEVAVEGERQDGAVPQPHAGGSAGPAGGAAVPHRTCAARWSLRAPPAPGRTGCGGRRRRPRGRPRSCRRRAAAGCSWTRSPSSSSRARWRAQVSRAAHRHAGERARDGRANPTPQ